LAAADARGLGDRDAWLRRRACGNLNAATGPLLEGLPPLLMLGITTAVAVCPMTWVVMVPRDPLLRGWLYRGG
jgi:antibiotic biosynthesis monooxygenase (ABM) superfamily enzyme